MKPATSKVNHDFLEFCGFSSHSLAAKIFADAVPDTWSPPPAKWWPEYQAARNKRERALTVEAKNLFATISKEFGRSTARTIFAAAVTSPVGKKKTEENQTIDRALFTHCMTTQSPRKTAKRVKELGLPGTIDTIETRVKRVMARSRKLTKAGTINRQV